MLPDTYPDGMPIWFDHAYHYRLPEGRWCYVTEPYAVRPDAFADLAYLADNGFDITISPGRARHDPGHTVAIEITPTRSHPSPSPRRMRAAAERLLELREALADD